jgi:hypothetical protein
MQDRKGELKQGSLSIYPCPNKHLLGSFLKHMRTVFVESPKNRRILNSIN